MAKEVRDADVYEVPALIITPDKAPVITGNYEVIERTLEAWKNKVSALNLTEDNLSEVQTIKRAAVAVRNRLDKAVEDTKRTLFNDPKKIFEARVKLLFGLITEVENSADTILDKIEQERRESINEVLNHYQEKFQEKYQLDAVHFGKIEYKKSYYNKGMDEKTRKDDLEQQFKDLKKAQDAYAANVRLITNTCKDEPRLNVERYIRDLDTLDVAIIIEDIETEKERLNSITETTSTSDVIKLGVPVTINFEKKDFETDFPGLMKSMKIQITYPCDVGNALTELFNNLRQYGIKIKQIKAETAKEAVF